MGSMLNGMAAHGGVVPVGVTYLVFSDYLRPTLRLAAMRSLPVQFVLSHNSIGIGRNGPTHQPVEYLASLRAIPNMLVLRPADAVEAAECWEVALSRRTGPSSLIFALQPLQPVCGGADGPNLSSRGAYIAAGLRRRRSSRHHSGNRIGGRDRPAGAHDPAGGGRADGRGLDAVMGAVRGAGPDLPPGGARLKYGPGRGRGGGAPGLGSLYRGRRRNSWA